ncbi:NACHT domain-containing protein [Paractinoplanes lichenicola]|uniref:NACHT domain-containing protein n=1 Tax=Paractinoplanes lichenicola TaxID=2802976 RepID=A0ABS1VHE0_9ACTN|nr:NACHT domain-containing protein [Actinoplanes lichenicola]MBL7254023.1 NACHT domain-containing protein [Actinoplanes lichenicola]
MPIEKILTAAITPLAKLLWKQLTETRPGAGLVGTAPPRLDSRLPGTKPKKELEETDIGKLASKLEDRLTELRAAEFSSLGEADVAAATSAVAAAFVAITPLDATTLFDLDLDPQRLSALVRESPAAKSRRAQMGDEGRLYDQLLDNVSIQIVEFFTSRPQFALRSQVETVRKLAAARSDIAGLADKVTTTADQYLTFERRYRETVARRLNRVYFYGLESPQFSPELNRHHPLDTAYVSLRLAPTRRVSAGVLAAGGLDPQGVLTSNRRLIITGPAGAGKTTILQWLALTSVGALDGAAASDLGGVIPFFLPIRRFREDRALPAPEHFLGPIAGHIAGDMPPGWVHDCLRTGRAAVLVDGIDEIPRARRRAALEWLETLVDEYGLSRFIVTSRPAALDTAWAGLDQFAAYEIMPMTLAESTTMIERWMETVGLSRSSRSAVKRLVEHLPSDPGLAQLVRNPALCVLVARLLILDGGVPSSLVRLCERSLRLFLGTDSLASRDVVRGIDPVEYGIRLSPEQQARVIAALAWWMIRNGLDSVSAEAVTRHLRNDYGDRSEQFLHFLLVRSGILTETDPSAVTFSNETLRNYLGAVGALDSGDAPMLANQAADGRWDEVTSLAIAVEVRRHGQSPLAAALVEQAKTGPGVRQDLFRLVGSGLAAVDGDSQLKRKLLQVLLPVDDVAQAGDLALCGPALLPLLDEQVSHTEQQVAAVVRTASLIGGAFALKLIKKHARDPRTTVVAELVRAWERFDVAEYASHILRDAAVHNVTVAVDQPECLEQLSQINLLRRLRCTGALPDLSALGRVHGLKTLEIADNPAFRDGGQLTLPPILAELSLEGCSEIRDLSWLSGARLRRLGIRRCRVELATLAGSPALETFELELGPDQADLADLSSAVPLTRLISTAPGMSLLPLAQHRKLEYLVVAGWPTESEFSVLASLPHLRTLKINGAVIDDFAPLASLSGLAELDLAFFTAPADSSPLRRLTALKSLRLDHQGIGLLPFAPPITAARLEIVRAVV